MSSNTQFIPKEFIRNEKGHLKPSSFLLLMLVLFLAAVHIVQLWTLLIPSSLLTRQLNIRLLCSISNFWMFEVR